MEFVQVDPSGKSSDSNGTTNIRKAAMRAFRRKQRLERVKTFKEQQAKPTKETSTPSSTPPTTATFVSYGSSHEEKPKREVVLRKKLALRDSLSVNDVSTASSSPTSIVDFHVSSCPTSPRLPSRELGLPLPDTRLDVSGLGYLFDYYLTAILPIMLPMNNPSAEHTVRIFWAGNLLRDPLILQAAITHAAVYLDHVYKKKTSITSAMNVRRFIRLLNERLSNQNPETDDILIQAIAMYSTNSVLTGDFAECAIHMNAVKEMVNLRGGKQKLASSSDIMSMILSWSDTQTARSSRTMPLFCTSTLPSASSSLYTPSEIYATYKPETLAIISSLQTLTLQKKAIEESARPEIRDILAYDTLRNNLEERLLTIQYHFSHASLHSLSFENRFLQTISIASSLYASLTFRAFSPSSQVLRTLGFDLQASVARAEAAFDELSQGIEAGPTLEAEMPFSEMLFWALWMGGVMCGEGEERRWWARRIARVLPWTLIMSWEEAEGCLGRVLWNKGLSSGNARGLWREVEEMAGLGSSRIQGSVSEIVDEDMTGPEGLDREPGEDNMAFGVVTFDIMAF
ncbi:hypothetical protein BJ875DRAFT_484582 [Amylocarpus encephaloides]|uniref:Transcription factor domain-containing protein n=1 Tax=Amylocarpus encephaloides TaxID=45428 RepID=A0A9P8C599_9HELO|nr:hypothetical protein BJ875DRAFT_484582 [Amylocarpus encephaloides]